MWFSALVGDCALKDLDKRNYPDIQSYDVLHAETIDRLLKVKIDLAREDINLSHDYSP